MFFVGYLLDKVQTAPSDLAPMDKRDGALSCHGLAIAILAALIIRVARMRDLPVV
jgi:hypothetical protein